MQLQIIKILICSQWPSGLVVRILVVQDKMDDASTNLYKTKYLYQILNNLLTSIERSVEWLVVRFRKKPENHRKGNISPISTGALWYSH